MAQFKIFNFLYLLMHLIAKFKGLQSEQQIISMTEITFCFNSSLEGQYILYESIKFNETKLLFAIVCCLVQS